MMNRIVATFLISILASFAFAQSEIQRPVTLEWDAVNEAHAYELEIQNLSSNKKINKNIPEARWKGQLPMGPYQYRIRSVDDRGAFGSWTDWENFTLKLPWPKPLEPSKEQKIVSKNNGVESVSFRWRPVDIADKYYFEVRGEDQRVLHKQITLETTVNVDLPVGQKYTWSVASLAKEDTELKLDSLNQSFQIHGGPLESPQVNRIQSNPNRSIVWTDVKNADSYLVQLEKRDSSGKWKLVKKLEAWPNVYLPMSSEFGSGDFRFSVKALNERFESSKEVVYEFSRMNERNPAQVQTSSEGVAAKASSYLKDSTYSWGLGLISSNYTFLYQDAFSTGSASAYELTVRDMIPMSNSDSILDLHWLMDLYTTSGYSVGTNFFIATWKKSISQWESFGGGLFFKETPIGAISSSLSGTTIQAIRTAGPSFTLGTRRPLGNYNWNLDFSVLLNMIGLRTPNGGNLNPSFGYKFESKAYFGKILQSPIYVGLNFFSNSVQYANNSSDIGIISGKALQTGSYSYANEMTWALLIGSDIAF